MGSVCPGRSNQPTAAAPAVSAAAPSLSDCPGTKHHVRGPHQTNNSLKLTITPGQGLPQDNPRSSRCRSSAATNTRRLQRLALDFRFRGLEESLTNFSDVIFWVFSTLICPL
ncbi:hypothetical protein SRHO_G00237190 [Serrasalmus rhombeus]